MPLAAGSEHAVPATKTYTNQLAALALLAALAGGREREIGDGLRRTIELQEGSLEQPRSGRSASCSPFAFVGRMFVIGRGIEFATAREIALKLTETCRIAAEPLTATDLAHGPVAALTRSFPSGSSPPVTVAGPWPRRAPGACGRRDRRRERQRGGRSPEPSSSSRCPRRRRPSSGRCFGPSRQLFAAAVAQAKGFDVDTPTGLEKVTLVA